MQRTAIPHAASPPAPSRGAGLRRRLGPLGALAISIGVMAPTLAMSITGVAAAVYAALYKPGKSPADGPAKMGRGFVLQSLMAGLALSLTNPYAVLTFTALAAWGFWDVISTAAREAYLLLPEAVRSRLSRKP